jgi:hypothetical protein
MDEDIAHRNCGPTGCAWLSELNGSLHQEIEKSRQSGTVYSSLGFDPDYLMYEDSLRLWRNRFFGGNYDEQFNFYLRYYLHTARSHPEWLVRKIIRQMALFYLGHKHIFITSPRAELGTRYAQTVDSLRALASSTPSYAPLSVYIKQCKKLSSSQEVISQPLVVRALGALLSIVYPLVFFATIAAALLSKGGLRGFHGRFAIVTLFVFSYNFGNCLLTSIVHSLSLTRYVVSQFSFGLLSECIALVFEVFATWRTSHLRRSTLT